MFILTANDILTPFDPRTQTFRVGVVLSTYYHDQTKVMFIMIISGQFHINPEYLGNQVECGQKVIRSGNNPNHGPSISVNWKELFLQNQYLDRPK